MTAHRLLVFCLLSTGCWRGPVPDAGGADAGAPETAFFLFAPADRTSALEPDARMSLLWLATPDDPGIGETLRRLRLTDQSSGAETTLETSPPERGTGGFVETRVRASSPLPEGFYRLWVPELPEGVATYQTPSPDGTHGVRFRVGSYPLLSGITVCVDAGSAGGSTLSVAFSEPMADATAERIQIEGAVCGAGTPNAARVDFACDEIPRDATLTVRIDAAVRAASGAALMHPDESAGAHTFALDELEWVWACGTYWGYWPTPY